MYLLFDFETSGIGGNFKKQSAIQLAWYLLGEDLQIINQHNYYIKGIKEINTEFHTDLTVEYINNNGKDAEYVYKSFINDLNKANILVAHNIDFDIAILKNEIEKIGMNPNIDWENIYNKMFCTMKNSINLCKICYNNGRYKYPKLCELYYHLYKKDPDVKLHNAIHDVEIMYRCFIKLHYLI